MRRERKKFNLENKKRKRDDGYSDIRKKKERERERRAEREIGAGLMSLPPMSPPQPCQSWA